MNDFDLEKSLIEAERRWRDDLKDVFHHIETANREMGEVRDSVSSLTADVGWLKKAFWVVATASVGTFFTVLGGMMIYLATK